MKHINVKTIAMAIIAIIVFIIVFKLILSLRVLRWKIRIFLVPILIAIIVTMGIMFLINKRK